MCVAEFASEFFFWSNFNTVELLSITAFHCFHTTTTAYHSVADWYMTVYRCNKNMLKQMDDRRLTWSSKGCQPAVPALRLNRAESDSSVCVIVSQGRVWSRPFTKINLNRQQSRKDDWYWGFPLEAQYPSICHLADTLIRWLTPSWMHAWTLRDANPEAWQLRSPL